MSDSPASTPTCDECFDPSCSGRHVYPGRVISSRTVDLPTIESTPADWLRDARHLTWRGRVSMAYYALRRLFVAPAPSPDRCVMGSPIGEHAWCPRHANGLWCRHHEKELRHA